MSYLSAKICRLVDEIDFDAFFSRACIKVNPWDDQ